MSKRLEIPDSYTYADYFAWPEAIRGELIDGQFYDQSPTPTAAHQDIAIVLCYQLMGYFLQHPQFRPYQAPFDVRLPADPAQEDAGIKDVVQPDLCLCDAAKIDDKGCRGAPEWIIEVLA